MRRLMPVLVLAAFLVGFAGCQACEVKKPLNVPPVEAPPAPPEQIVQPTPPPPPPPPPTPAQEPLVPVETAKAIQDLADQYPGLFTFDPNTGMFRFNSDITFDSGSAVVKAQAREALTKLAQILINDKVKDRRMTIIGHTDGDRVAKAATIANLKALNKSPDNMGLSEARAEAVASVLQSGGVDAARMATAGRGQSQPIADNKTPAGKARNRRVEIFLTPMSPAGSGK